MPLPPRTCLVTENISGSRQRQGFVKRVQKDLHGSTLGRQFIAQGDGFIMCWHICVKKGNWTLVLATKINWKLK